MVTVRLAQLVTTRAPTMDQALIMHQLPANTRLAAIITIIQVTLLPHIRPRAFVQSFAVNPPVNPVSIKAVLIY